MWLASWELVRRWFGVSYLLLTSLPYSSLTLHWKHWGEWQQRLTQEMQLRRNLIQSSWRSMHLTAAMKFHFELSMSWWSNEMKTTLQMAGESNNSFCRVFRGAIRLCISSLWTRPPKRLREMNSFVILLSLPSHLPASVLLGINSFSHKKSKLSTVRMWMVKLGAWHCDPLPVVSLSYRIHGSEVTGTKPSSEWTDQGEGWGSRTSERILKAFWILL